MSYDDMFNEIEFIWELYSLGVISIDTRKELVNNMYEFIY